LEGLNTQTVECRRAVEQHGMSFQHVFQNIPDHRILAVHNLLGRLNGLYNSSFNQLADNEWLEQFGGHILWQTAFMQLQFRAHHNDGAAGIVYALTQQVLAEPTLLSFQHIAERLQGTVSVRAHSVYFP